MFSQETTDILGQIQSNTGIESLKKEGRKTMCNRMERRRTRSVGSWLCHSTIPPEEIVQP
jgi:hypothetical protein